MIAQVAPGAVKLWESTSRTGGLLRRIIFKSVDLFMTKISLITIVFVLAIVVFLKLYNEFRSRKIYNKGNIESKYDNDVKSFMMILYVYVQLAKCEDNSISKKEEEAIKSTIDNFIKMISKAEKKSINSFTELHSEILKEYVKIKKQNSDNLANIITAFSKESQSRKEELMLGFVMYSAIGRFSNKKKELLFQISRLLNYPVDEVEKMIDFIFKGESKTDSESTKYYEKNNPYDILGCNKNDSMEIIKKQYKKLIKKYHPDYLKSKDIDEAFIKFANEKIQEISEAYDIIKKNRK
jgi:DnaJ like chaperone protein